MNAALDGNTKQTATARLETDGVTITRLTATGNKLNVTGTTTSAVTPTTFAATDDNGRISWFAVSENSPTTLVALQCDSGGNLLIKIL